MSLRSVADRQRLTGEFLVLADGTISLGPYGSVSVVGQTLDEIRLTVADHLAASRPSGSGRFRLCLQQQSLFLVMLGGGMGDQLARFPCTGNETVMDALSQVNGLCYESSTRMWIARPDRDCAASQILPIDWLAITQRAEVETNYQLMPGDRLSVAQDRLVALDGAIMKLARPFERLFTFTILGTGTHRSVRPGLRNDLSILTPFYEHLHEPGNRPWQSQEQRRSDKRPPCGR